MTKQSLWLQNPRYQRAVLYGPRQQGALGVDLMEAARSDLRHWPICEPTPLVSMPGLANELGVGAILVKNEGLRKPLKSFKALGGAYALAEAIRDRIEARLGYRPDQEAVLSGHWRAIVNEVHATAASDGNHGRSLAWGAQLLGCSCTIYLPTNVSAARADLIAMYGAHIVRVDGNYDAAVGAAFADAKQYGRTPIQDTSFPGYLDPCRRIMAGYTLMAEEIRQAWMYDRPPSHVFLQVGCGGMAAAVVADFWLHYGNERPRVVLVEAIEAASMYRSLKAGKPSVVGGGLDTIMIGISCGNTSLLAWDILEEGAEFAMAIPDAPAIEAMRLLNNGVRGDPSMVIGETGVAGLAALITAVRQPEIGTSIGIDRDSRILLIGSEGAVDRDAYTSHTGLAITHCDG